VVLKIETFLTSQNLTNDRELLVLCSEVQECGVVKTYLGVLSPQIDPPDFLPILTKFSKDCKGWPRKFYMCMWTNVQGLYHIRSRYLLYRLHTLKFLEGYNFCHVFTFCSIIFKPVFLEIRERSTKRYFNT